MCATRRDLRRKLDLRKGPLLEAFFLFCYRLRIKKQLLVPQGFAHGFQYLAKPVVLYKCDQYYNKESEGGIRLMIPL
jgi:dTDP-4-dehydrorhamnose 3,5-epimerase